jgi:hypothetical protein
MFLDRKIIQETRFRAL